jgi:hypothetical protein
VKQCTNTIVTVAEGARLYQPTAHRVVTVPASGVTIPASGRHENSRESHERQPISSVSTPIDPKFCGQAPKVAKMLLHENHSLSCLTTPGIERSWFETKKRTSKIKTARSKYSS